ncbi:MAG: putative manganese transporter [Hespellia sp.]|nr:putative manganese transporter [Hespellia sp.]
MIYEVFIETITDCMKMLPFLFVAFLLIEYVEHYSSAFTEKLLSRERYAGPAIGAVLGCFPQCGFSAVASSLYASGVVSLGTLLAVFLATSDEAILVMLGNPGHGKEVLSLLLAKIVIAVASGYVIDAVYLKKEHKHKDIHNMCHDCGCEHSHNIWRPALTHTVKLFVYIFLISFILELVLEMVGTETMSHIFLKNSMGQIFLTAIIGLIPNCGASVMLTELYLSGITSFAATVAGLSTGAGVGLLVLFRFNKPMKENFMIVGLLYGLAVAAGIILTVIQL